MLQNRHIAIFISFSGRGGVERMINNLAQGFIEAGFKVDMIIARAHGEHLESIPDDVRQVRLGRKHTISALPGLVQYLRREDPDALLAVKDRAIKTAVLARWISGNRVWLAGRIGTTVSAALEGKSPVRKWIWRTGMRIFYRHADRIIAVSRGVADDIHDITKLPESRISIVCNPVITQRILTLAKEPAEHMWLENPGIKVIIGIGRLTIQKDFPTLIKAFAKVRELIDSRLIILGEGKQRQEIESLIRDLGLAEEIHLPGFVTNPYRWLARSSLFVLSSRWEGSPNVLTEALALGVPVVSTDCRSGPGEILQEGRFGPLVPVADERELAGAILDTLADPLPRDDLRDAVRRFTVEESVKGYLESLQLKERSG